MKFWENAFELYINSSIHVALAVVSFTLITFFERNLNISVNLLSFIFFATITGYNFVKYAGLAKMHHTSLAGNLKFIQVFSLLCFIAMAFFAIHLNVAVLITTAFLGFFTLLYAIPIFGGGRNLRSLSGLKIFIIALVWAGSTVILPMVNVGVTIGQELVIDFLQRLCLVIVLTLPFELRDLNFDAAHLGTIPQRIGARNTKILGTLLLLLIFISNLFQENFESDEFLAQLIILIIAGLFLWNSKIDQDKYYASFWVEAIPVFYLIVYVLVEFNFESIPS